MGSYVVIAQPEQLLLAMYGCPHVQRCADHMPAAAPIARMQSASAHSSLAAIECACSGASSPADPLTPHIVALFMACAGRSTHGCAHAFTGMMKQHGEGFGDENGGRQVRGDRIADMVFSVLLI